MPKGTENPCVADSIPVLANLSLAGENGNPTELGMFLSHPKQTIKIFSMLAKDLLYGVFYD